MRASKRFPGLTPDQIAGLQAAIDDDSIWASVEGGIIAMALIDEGTCRKAPGVLTMWIDDDDRYRPIRSIEEQSKLIERTIREFPATCDAMKKAKAEVDFMEKHRDELVRLQAERLLRPAFLPWTARRLDAEYQTRVNALRAADGLPPLPASREGA